MIVFLVSDASRCICSMSSLYLHVHVHTHEKAVNVTHGGARQASSCIYTIIDMHVCIPVQRLLAGLSGRNMNFFITLLCTCNS